MRKSLTLTKAQEAQKEKDRFLLSNIAFTAKWHCSLAPCIVKYGKKLKGVPKVKELTQEQIEQGILLYPTMRMPDFCDMFNITSETAKSIFGEKLRVYKFPWQCSYNKALHEREVSALNEQYKKAMEMWNISRDEVKRLLIKEWRGFSEIFAGEKVDGRVVPKKLIYVQR